MKPREKPFSQQLKKVYDLRAHYDSELALHVYWESAGWQRALAELRRRYARGRKPEKQSMRHLLALYSGVKLPRRTGIGKRGDTLHRR